MFSAKPGLKKFSTLDYTYLAQMTDEQHTTALRRGLYALRKSDKEMYGNIGGAEILELSKLTDRQWENVKKRNLLDIKVDHYIKNFWTYEFINQVVDMSDIDWFDIEYSGLLDTGVAASQLYKMLETSKSDEAKNLVPSYLARVRALSNIEKDVKYHTQKKFTAEHILSLAGVDNDKWQLLMEITNNLTDIKMSPSDLSNVMNFDDDTIDTLRKRNLLTTAKITFGLEDLALLSDEEWANVQKRKLDEMEQFSYRDWGYLAALTDEQFKLAQDKKLFEDRAPLTKSERLYSGEEISLLVNTLDEKGWENFEKRGLYNNFYVFSGFYYGAANGRTAIALPQTRIPKASELEADGVNVKEITTKDENGNEIKNKVVYLEKGLDLSKYGFDKGVTAENFNVIVHGFDNNIQQAMLEALEMPDSDALLSTSYIFYDKGNYHTFRPQGFIKNIPSDNIGVAYYRDFGSGCRKTEEMLINDYLSDKGNIYRKYFSELLKKELNLNDEEYLDLYQKIKDKPIEQIEKEAPHAAYAIKNIFAKMEIHKRKFKRDYNEILVGKGKTTGVFFEGADEQGNKYKVENMPEFLRKYARDNDLPIIYFGE